MSTRWQKQTDGTRCRNRTIEITAQTDSPVIRSDAYIALAAACRVAGHKGRGDGALPPQSTSAVGEPKPHRAQLRT